MSMSENDPSLQNEKWQDFQHIDVKNEYAVMDFEKLLQAGKSNIDLEIEDQKIFSSSESAEYNHLLNLYIHSLLFHSTVYVSKQ
jgi:hypothetical protein